MNVLFISNLFPNVYEPARGVLNFHQIRHLARLTAVQVLAPYDWFFIKGRFAPPAPLPTTEELGGLRVWHPRNFYLPKIGRPLNPWFFALSAWGPIRRIRREFPCDLLFVNWAYPDACGIAKVARWLQLPFVVSISGSDVNLYLNFRIRRRQILRMLAAARAVTVRSQALKDLLTSHGVAADKIHVLYNGVDREQFQPAPRPPGRRRLLYFGRLSPEKGVADLLRALAQVANVQLVIVGDGPEGPALQALAHQLQLDNVVTWLGTKKPAEIAAHMHAADLLCLPSHMEGVPNVALEAFATGLPVVATAVGGLPEIVTAATGLLAAPHNPGALAQAITQALSRPWDPVAIRAHSARFDWSENARQLFAILQAAVPARA